MTIKNVIFDIGNVVVKWAPPEIIATTFPHRNDHQSLGQSIFRSEIWRDLNKGFLSEQQAKARYLDHLDITEEQMDLFFNRVKETQTLIEGTQALMEQLELAGYQLYALTDNVHEVVAYLQQKYTFWPRFRGAVVSAECGVLEPDPVIYRQLTERFGLIPEESVFMDDMPANIEGAIGEGFHSFQFVSAHEATDELRRLGVKI